MTELEAALAAWQAANDRLAAAIREAAAPKPEAPERLLSIDEAAALLGTSRRTLYAQLRRNRGRSVTVGRRRLIPASALREFTDQAA